MDSWLYVMFIEKTKTYNRLTKAAVERHVANLKKLDDACIAFSLYVANPSEPLVLEGFATYKLKAMQAANRENNYLLS